MPGKNQSFRFTAKLSAIKISLISTAVFLPQRIVNQLPSGRVRTKGTLNGIPFALAAQPKKEGGRYFSVNASMRKAAGINVGDSVEVIFRLVHPDAVDVPKELAAVLAQDEDGRTIWKQLSSGVKRNIILYVNGVKNIDGRINRALEAIEKAKSGLLTSQKSQRKKPKTKN